MGNQTAKLNAELNLAHYADYKALLLGLKKGPRKKYLSCPSIEIGYQTHTFVTPLQYVTQGLCDDASTTELIVRLSETDGVVRALFLTPVEAVVKDYMCPAIRRCNKVIVGALLGEACKQHIEGQLLQTVVHTSVKGHPQPTSLFHLAASTNSAACLTLLLECSKATGLLSACLAAKDYGQQTALQVATPDCQAILQHYTENVMAETLA
eukprot:NODE_4390_length_796_cov_50.704036_g4232_i0.p1 GENE.NODE_4390_length_796_cov_50.704036_g4232_i0~~NODE_4390_length_796_cov_50.704036_g4232_i0.p1  ORF type:complete len:233 (+),score=79.87 NODE_4390_length_796_cov_50.704036_g4232_i0:74-700(+)